MSNEKCCCEKCSNKYNDDCCDPQLLKKPCITEQQKQRVVDSINKRKELLCTFKNKEVPYFNQNCDESLPHFWGSFNKCLPQNNLGLPDPCAYTYLRLPRIHLGSILVWYLFPYQIRFHSQSHF